MDEQNHGVQVVLMEPIGKLQTILLPQGTPQGRYTFQCGALASLRIEGKNGCWHAVCGESMRFVNCPPDKMFDAPLVDHMVLVIRRYLDEESTGGEFFLYVEELPQERKIYCNFELGNADQISIGRNSTNDISYNNPMVSGVHAFLTRTPEGWTVTDNNSLNGVYVNEWRVKSAQLKLGDVVFIVGLRIIVGIGFVSVNCRGREIRLNQYKLRPLQAITDELGSKQQPNDLFNRPPRRRLALKQEPIVIEGPPMSMSGSKIPLVLRMGSSMVMGTKSLLSGNATMMLSSVLFPLLSNRYTEKERQDYEERRTVAYLRYLNRKEEEINQERKEEEQILRSNYPPLSDVLKFAEERKRLWERQKTDDDFLVLRIGAGELPLLAEIDYPKERFSVEEDSLEQKMYALAEMPVQIRNVPIQTSLFADYVCGVSGTEQQRLSFLKHMILYLVLTHSYDEVKVVFLGNEAQLRQLEFLRYIPHIWNDQQTVRFLAATESEAYQIGRFLKSEIEADLKDAGVKGSFLKRRPYYVIFAADKRLFDTVEILKDVLNADENVGVSIVAGFEDIPKECTKIFQMNDTGANSVFYIKQPERQEDRFILDLVDDVQLRRSMQALSNTRLRFLSQTYALPKTYTFMEMFGVGKVEHLNVLERWRKSNPIKSLATPVGVATDGSLLNLDLHQKFQGPHGLVAGMTGSGKSEFLITYILSLAINYSPDDVAFVLIDYKGGGLAGAFDDPEKGIHLPHLVGTITNLDGATVQRSMKSIQSELLRRQRIFREAKSLSDEGSVDIYSYQRLYRAGKVTRPLPHLFLISDEFAELKSQQPEFMDSLISAARIGRSLGVHLILATQKPAGVVNDQIRSNTKFRVCLRVQDKADSHDMLNRPDAAELKDTGRFYLQVGYNELFVMGQSAWAGAAYEPQDEIVTRRDDSITVIDNVGQKVCSAKPAVEKQNSGMTQLVAVVKHLSEIATAEKIIPRKLWLEPLPKLLDINDLRMMFAPDQTEGKKVLIGLADEPENQAKYPVLVNLRSMQHLLLVGQSGSGKSVFVQTLLMSIAEQYTPEEVIFYCADFSGGSLNVFRQLPHCGAVLDGDDEDGFRRVLNMLMKVVEERKRLFKEANVSSYLAFTEYEKLPLILVAIDNFNGIMSFTKGNEIITGFAQYLKDTWSYGIRFVITVNFLNEVNSRIRQQIDTYLTLQMKDRYEYGDALGVRCTFDPDHTPGRGLCERDMRILEYQLAQYDAGKNEKERNARLSERVALVANNSKQYPHAPILPRVQQGEFYEDFCRDIPHGRLPIGYSIESVKKVSLPYCQFSALSIYFGNEAGIGPVVNNLLYAGRLDGARFLLLQQNGKSAFSLIPGGEDVERFDLTEEGCRLLLNRIVEEIEKRKIYRNRYAEKNGLDEADSATLENAAEFIRAHTKPLYVLIEQFAGLIAKSDTTVKKVFPTIFQLAHLFNIYVIGCFYPDDTKGLSDPMLTAFNPEKLTLMFGGQYHKAGIIGLDIRHANMKECNPDYAQGTMMYRQKLYDIVMPCGPISDADLDPDAKSIF